MRGLILVLVLCIFTLAQASSQAPGGLRTLVLIENEAIKTSHSVFFGLLEARGFQLTFTTSGSRVEFTTYEEFNFDNLVLFSPKLNEFGGELSTLRILEFMKNGGNVLVAGAQTTGNAVRDLVYEFGIEVDNNGLVIDHFEAAASDDGTHTLIKSSKVLSSKIIFNTPLAKPILFKGIAHKISENPLTFSLLRGNPTSFSGSPDDVATAPFVLGSRTGLVSSLQARNNARVTFSGSLDLFSNKFFEDATGDNKLFADAITSWTFQRRGVLRHISTYHHRLGEDYQPANYIIKQDMEYSVKVEEWNGTQWVPFAVDDMQVEFKMLDPYIRTSLKPDGKGTFSVQVKLPDVYGVYTFRVEYNRIGYTFLRISDIVPIVPLHHNQYERFIHAAYPYYGSAFSMMVGLFLFSAVFLYSRDLKKVKTA